MDPGGGSLSKQPDSYEAMIAEIARSEASGKVSLFGIFSDKKILLPKGTPFPVTFPLAIYMAFFGAEDIKSATFSIAGPSKIPIISSQLSLPTPMKKDKPSTVLINMPNMQIPSTGRYDVTVSLDGHPYTTYFIVEFAN